MGVHEHIDTVFTQGSSRTRLRTLIVALVLLFIAFVVLAMPVSAAGAMQISGLGEWPGEGECTDPGYDYSFVLTGDLDGCVYVIVDSAEWSPSGTYRELGTEYYFIEGGDLGKSGYFETTYRFSGKFEDSDIAREIFGRCQHPLVPGSGSGDFSGATGRLDFKDDIDAGNFPYRGHLRY